MKNLLMTVTSIAALTLPAALMAQSATAIDTNGDGVMTLEEVQAVHEEVTAEAFTAADANADGALDDAEMLAAQDKGLMPATEG